MSFRIRYDKSKIIRTECQTELKSEIFKLIKNFVGLNTKNPLYQRKTHISTGCRCCCSICCSGVSASSLSCCCLVGPSMQWYHTGLGLVCWARLHQGITLGLVLHQGFTLGGAPLDPAGRWELVLPAPPLRHRCCSSPTGDGQTLRNQL